MEAFAAALGTVVATYLMLRAGHNELRSEFRSGMGELRNEVRTEFGEVGDSIDRLGDRLDGRIDRLDGRIDQLYQALLPPRTGRPEAS